MGHAIDELIPKFCVPEDLTYFEYGDRRLVVSPESGARAVLSLAEFSVLEQLCRGGHREPSFEPTDTFRKIAARLLLNWMIFLEGRRPTPRVSEPALTTAYYQITEGCNLRCPYCYASSEKCLPNELSTAESERLVEQIAELGATTLVFTGGEPLIRKDLFHLAEYARERGLKCNIITNGTMIRSAKTASRFAELFDVVTLSIDGGTAEVNDRTRGKGSFARTIRALKLLNEAGVEPKINHVVTDENIDELGTFNDLMGRHRVACIKVMEHVNIGRGANDGVDFGFQQHRQALLLAWTLPDADRLLPDGPKVKGPCTVAGNCGLAGNEIYINSLGDVYPCKLITELPHKAGNIRDDDLASLYNHPMMRELRRSTVFGGSMHEDCAKCYVRSTCGGGCRAYHMANSGDIRRNSRLLCRSLRHTVITGLWVSSGLSKREVAEHDLEMSVPKLVATGTVHPVYGDWMREAQPRRERRNLPIVEVSSGGSCVCG